MLEVWGIRGIRQGSVRSHCILAGMGDLGSLDGRKDRERGLA